MRGFLLALLLAGLSGLLQARETPDVGAAALPPEAQKILQLITRGGPYAYPRDGVTFGNYEHRLPLKPPTYYREFTVPVPGLKGRGPRRIIAGAEGERYYSADHYRSFRRVRP